MLQLILHGIGDYFLQTDKQATNKKNKGAFGRMQCLIHCITYSLPFLFIGSWAAVSVIFVTHFIIDRSNIVAYGIAFKNQTKYNEVEKEYEDGTKLCSDNHGKYDIRNFGFAKERPLAITIWLYIICDNLTHIICNYIALKYL